MQKFHQNPHEMLLPLQVVPILMRYAPQGVASLAVGLCVPLALQAAFNLKSAIHLPIIITTQMTDLG